ncbi:hypothetical protein HY251_03870, partial [bacterium]|nr:hypothetical protein [bacterium]
EDVPDASGVVGEEIVQLLSVHGALPLGRIAREIRISMKRLEPHVAELERAGTVSTETHAARDGKKLRVVALAVPASVAISGGGSAGRRAG